MHNFTGISREAPCMRSSTSMTLLTWNLFSVTPKLRACVGIVGIQILQSNLPWLPYHISSTFKIHTVVQYAHADVLLMRTQSLKHFSLYFAVRTASVFWQNVIKLRQTMNVRLYSKDNSFLILYGICDVFR